MVTLKKIREYLNNYIGDEKFKDVTETIFKPKIDWIHKKTGNIYNVENIILDCTNATEGRLLVIYKKKFDSEKFARELSEVMIKFEPDWEQIKSLF